MPRTHDRTKIKKSTDIQLARHRLEVALHDPDGSLQKYATTLQVRSPVAVGTRPVQRGHPHPNFRLHRKHPKLGNLPDQLIAEIRRTVRIAVDKTLELVKQRLHLRLQHLREKAFDDLSVRSPRLSHAPRRTVIEQIELGDDRAHRWLVPRGARGRCDLFRLTASLRRQQLRKAVNNRFEFARAPDLVQLLVSHVQSSLPPRTLDIPQECPVPLSCRITMTLADRLNRRIDYRDVRIHIPGKRDRDYIERRWQQRPRESAALLSKRSMYIADQALCAR
ncbi:MAG TPA: hypothetical protein VK730_09265 [Solirubrobacteraceae bacterium]|nr:hypothetical protein [Solirubrobacteraceae bacterium]